MKTIQFLKVDDLEPLAIVDFDPELQPLVGDEIEIPRAGEFRIVRRRWAFHGDDRHLILIMEVLV
ncbi:MAG: hypothetical protein ACJ711_06595 [Ornithinibacter sp.]